MSLAPKASNMPARGVAPGLLRRIVPAMKGTETLSREYGARVWFRGGPGAAR